MPRAEQDVESGVGITIMNRATVATTPLARMDIALRAINQRRDCPQIRGNVQTANIGSVERNDMVNLVRNARFQSKPPRLGINGMDGGNVRPTRHSRNHANSAHSASGRVFRLVLVVMRYPKPFHFSAVRVSPLSIHGAHRLAVRGVIFRVAALYAVLVGCLAARSYIPRANLTCSDNGNPRSYVAVFAGLPGKVRPVSKTTSGGVRGFLLHLIHRTGLLVQDPMQIFDAVFERQNHGENIAFSHIENKP